MAQNITFDPNIKGKIWDLHNVPLRLCGSTSSLKFHWDNYIIQEYVNYRYCLFIIIKILKVLGFTGQNYAQGNIGHNQMWEILDPQIKGTSSLPL